MTDRKARSLPKIRIAKYSCGGTVEVEPILNIAKKTDDLLSLLVPFREGRVTIKTQQPLWMSFFTDLVPEVELQNVE